MGDSRLEYQSSDIAMDSTLESQVHATDPAEEAGGTESDNGSQSFPRVDERYQADADSAIGSISTTSTTTSLRSSIYEHVEENGFTYHRYKEGRYALPNDELERQRLDLQHMLWLVTFRGRLYNAPVKDPKNVLDIATGTGIWAIEFADQHPDAHVVGTDLSPIQPLFVAPNCRFEVSDAEDEWAFNNKFDYMHGRALFSCFNNPKLVIQRAYDSLEPGGYLELNDFNFPMRYIGATPTDSAIYKWQNYGLEAAQKTGRSLTNVQYYAQWMREIGFEDVVDKDYYWPSSPWAKGKHLKRIAEIFRRDMTGNIDGLTMRTYTQFLGWTPEEVKAFTPLVVKDFYDLSVHAYMPIKSVYGRKPLATSEPPIEYAAVTA